LLKEHRLEAGLSQAELARASGISAGHIATIETGARGHHPGRDTVISLCEALGADLAEMLESAGLPAPTRSDTVANDVVAAIRRDRWLSSSRKATLIQLYEWLGGGGPS
jgi:transcriptional regulator with XRE-family HTH domain